MKTEHYFTNRIQSVEFSQIPQGHYFTHGTNLYMKLENGYNEHKDENFNCVNLSTGKLDYINYGVKVVTGWLLTVDITENNVKENK
jgi:hypothetical protein